MEAPQSEISVVGRMLRVFYAPSQTFEAVAKQRSAADWLVPTAVAALGFCFVSEAKITQQMPGEMFAAVPILAFMVLFINAAIYLVVGKVLGGMLNYGQCLTITAYASLIIIPQQIASMLLAKETTNVQLVLGVFPFAVWWSTVFGIGLSIVGQIERSRAYMGTAALALISLIGYAAGFQFHWHWP